MNKNILITGGLGFIGTHCIEKWKSLNYNIFIVDDLSSNAIHPKHEIAKGCDISLIDLKKYERVGDIRIFDLILHLASPVGPVGILKHTGDMGKMIVDDINYLIGIANNSKCPLIHVSTSEIYGYRKHKSYLNEYDDKVLKGKYTVRNEYAIAKLLSEIILKNHAKINKDFRYQIIRPFNVTGKFQLPDGGFVLPRFVNQALNNEDITVYYSGEQIRAFTWVKDIVEGIYLTTTCSNDLWNQEWNIGNEFNEETILYLAEKVKEITNSKSNIVHVDPIKLHGELFAEAPEKIPNSTKIKEKLGWKATKGIYEIIFEVIDYYKHEYSIIKGKLNG